jgi:hypothetical protein
MRLLLVLLLRTLVGGWCWYACSMHCEVRQQPATATQLGNVIS